MLLMLIEWIQTLAGVAELERALVAVEVEGYLGTMVDPSVDSAACVQLMVAVVERMEA